MATRQVFSTELRFCKAEANLGKESWNWRIRNTAMPTPIPDQILLSTLLHNAGSGAEKEYAEYANGVASFPG